MELCPKYFFKYSENKSSVVIIKLSDVMMIRSSTMVMIRVSNVIMIRFTTNYNEIIHHSDD